MKRFGKKLLVFLLVISMVLPMLPISAFAEALAMTEPENVETLEEPLPSKVEIQPEEPEQEAVEKSISASVETDPVENELSLVNVMPESLTQTENGEDSENEEQIPLSHEELEKLGIHENETIYEITDGTRVLKENRKYTIRQYVTIDRVVYVSKGATIILPDDLRVHFKKGIRVTKNDTLIIRAPQNSKGTGVLIARGEENCAGIGGGNRENAANIEIYGGFVEAYGGLYASGIGGGENGNGGALKVFGGNVKATGGQYGAAIGSGWRGSCGTVVIEGGEVTAKGGDGSAGIGGGREGNTDKTIQITGGTVNATGGKWSGPGIGCGWRGKCNGEIIINGATVTAQGGINAAGIGGGSEGNCSTVTISGNSIVNATGGENGAGIGGGTFGNGGTVTVNGGKVTATGGQNGAGIGGGWSKGGGTVTVNGGTVTATGGRNGAGIGGGENGSGGTFEMKGGTVTAKGGSDAAGIGGGNHGNGGIVTVNGGEVTAEGGVNGPGIGCNTFNLGDGVDVYDASDSQKQIMINNPTPEKLKRIRKVSIKKRNFISEPQVATGLVYNGQKQVGYLNPEAHTIVTGDTSATDVKEYTFTVTPEQFYFWPDGTNGTKTCHWSIGRAKATVKADDKTITYGDREPVLTATVSGIVDGYQPTYQLSCDGVKNAGKHTIKATGNAIQGSYDMSFQNGILTVQPKNVTEKRIPVFQAIPEGSGEFIAPTFHDSILDEDIPGTLTYTYNGRKMTREDLENELGTLPARSQGTINWRYEADDNFTGTISGSIDFAIVSTAHTHRFNYIDGIHEIIALCRDDDCELSKLKNAVRLTLTAPKDLKYDGHAKEVTFADSQAEIWEKTTGRKRPRITYTADRGSELTQGKPVKIGSYTASIRVRGARAKLRFSIVPYALSVEPTASTGLIFNGKDRSGAANNGEHVTLTGTLAAANAGEYTFTATPEAGCSWADGTAETKTYQWRIAPKDVSTIRPPVTQNISEGSGKFTAPGDFHDRQTGLDIPGTLTYTYNGRQMTKEAIEAELAKLPAGRIGWINWTYTAGGNFTGIIGGIIIFTVRGIEFTVDGAPANANNAVTIKENPTYGDTWAEIVTIKSDDIVASLGGRTGTGRYFLNVSGRPDAGKQEYTVLFTGHIGWRPYRNVTVLTGTVDIAKTDYENVTKEVSAELNTARGSTVTMTLPTIPRGTSYGTPVKTADTDPYTLSPISGNRITVTSEGIPADTKAMTFTVPVIPDGNHNGYNITVTMNLISSRPKVTVEMDSDYFWGIPVYTATIIVDTATKRVEHSTNGQLYTRGDRMISLFPINHFFIRVTTAYDDRYVYEYRYGEIIPQEEEEVRSSSHVEEDDEDPEDEEQTPLSPDVLETLGIPKNETVYEIKSYTKCLEGGKTYTITSDVINTKSAYVNGSATILLPDDKTLNFKYGLEVSQDYSLTIRSSGSKGNGTLIATGEESYAGIGGHNTETAGTIRIEGGIVKAQGGYDAAGIGGGRLGASGTIDIRGGIVEATGGNNGAGIGGGRERGKSDPTLGGKITISGGTVTATGGSWGAGIGGGSSAQNEDIVISGGTVTAKGGTNGGAGIGSGNAGHGGTVIISGGNVTTNGGATGGAGIGGGYLGNGGSVEINGGTVNATGSWNGAGIGGGGRGSGGTVTISGNSTVTAIGTRNAAGIGGGEGGNGGTLIVNNGTVTATGGQNAAGIGGGENGSGGTFEMKGGIVTAKGGSDAAGIGGGNNGNGGTVTVNGGTVTATGGRNGAGIGGGRLGNGGTVTISGNSIVTATGGQGASGIGGGRIGNGGAMFAHGGTVMVNGGNVTATGGQDGAGIGGGFLGNGGNVTISGGNVTATGGQNGAGIGGGWRRNGGTVTVNGGTVTATGGRDGAGIGGGFRGNGDTVTVNGGTVTAKGGNGAAGIGKGGHVSAIEGGHGGEVTINAGKVTAEGSVNGPGICCKTLKLGVEIRAFDFSNGQRMILIDDPTPQKLNGIRKVIIEKGRIVSEPQVATGLVYNGQQQTGYFNPDEHAIVTGIVSAIESGNYEFKVTPAPGYIWEDGTNGTKTCPWSIARAKATVKADNKTITYGDSVPVLTATVTGTFRREQLNYTLNREMGTDTGSYTITPSGDQIQGNYEVSFQNGVLTVHPKNATQNRKPVFQTIPAGTGEFTEPTFHDSILDEDIPGTLTYTYNGKEMLREDLSHALGALQPGSQGTVNWHYDAGGNFTGTIRGSIDFAIVSTTHTHRFKYINVVGHEITALCRDGNCDLSKFENAVRLTLTAPKDLKYDGSTKEVTFAEGQSERWKAVMHRDVPKITYTADRGSELTQGKPVKIGSYTASITVNGNRANLRFSIIPSGLSVEPKTATGLIFNGKDQSGTVNNGEHVTLAGTLTAANAGEYTFTATPEASYRWADGTANTKTYEWRIAPKDVSTTRLPVMQNVLKGSGEFTAPGDFHDRQTGLDIPGTLTYTYNGSQMTKEAIEAELAKLPAGRIGWINWTYTAGGNFTGMIGGSILFVIQGIEFTVNGAPANANNAVTIKKNTTYGDTWAEIVTIKSDDIVASVNGRTGTGRYFLQENGRPGAGKQEYTVLFNGFVGLRPYRNVTVFTGTVDIAKADYENVTTTASAKLNTKKGSTVTVSLPSIPRGTSYGTPTKKGKNDPYTLSPISENRITVTSEGIPADTKAMTFTVPVIPDGNHNGYNITVTMNLISSRPKVTVEMGSDFLWIIPVYTATINVDTATKQVEHSTDGQLYTRGDRMISPFPINHFFIRVTTADDNRYVYEYWYGEIIPR